MLVQPKLLIIKTLLMNASKRNKREDLNKPSFFMGTISFKILFMSKTINAVNVIFIYKCPKIHKYSAYGINWFLINKD